MKPRNTHSVSERCALLFWLGLVLTAAQLAGQEQLSYTGKLLTRAAAPVTGPVDLTVKLYDALEGGNLAWSETHTNVPLVNGIFHIQLGTYTPLHRDSRPLWLTLTVGADAEMAPRRPVPAPVGGVPPGTIVMWSGTTIPNGWILCDGSNGAPDLRQRFVRGAGSVGEIGSTGGSESHTHSASINNGGGPRLDDNSGGSDWDVGVSVSSAVHLPPFYALAFIMKR